METATLGTSSLRFGVSRSTLYRNKSTHPEKEKLDAKNSVSCCHEKKPRSLNRRVIAKFKVRLYEFFCMPHIRLFPRNSAFGRGITCEMVAFYPRLRINHDLQHDHFYPVEFLRSPISLTKLFRVVGIDDTFTGLKAVSRKWFTEFKFGSVYHNGASRLAHLMLACSHRYPNSEKTG